LYTSKIGFPILVNIFIDYYLGNSTVRLETKYARTRART